MARFGKRSQERLNTCHNDLQKICNEAIKIYDFTIICGHRGEEAQNEAYNTGASNAKFGQSKHNKVPSEAIDVAPYPIDWNDTERFARLAGIIQAVAFEENIPIRWGGDFKNLKDMPHFELV